MADMTEHPAIARLERALSHPEKLLEQWGALGVARSQRAFREQRLGDEEWPARYPNQAPPKLNIAGALSDFNAGATQPKPNRFQDRPALVDEGNRGGLLSSLNWAVLDPHTVEWGTNKPYAAVQQTGGKTVIRLTDDAVSRAKAWLLTKKGSIRKGREAYAEKLSHALRTKIHAQRIIPRPFVGIPNDLRDDMLKATERFFSDSQKRDIL